MVTKVPAEMLEDDYVEEGQSIPVGSGGTGITSYTAGNYIRAATSSTMEQRTPGQVLADIGAQPADGTLTALAAQNWSANAVPVGTGADTVTQLSIAANTFPARASTGDVAAKSITDFGLSLVDDADASTARSTLGLPVLDQGVFTPTITNIANVSSSTPRECSFLRIGNTVVVAGRVEVTTSAAADTVTTIDVTLPVAPATFNNTWEAAGTATAAETVYRAGLVFANTGGTSVRVQYQSASASAKGLIFHFSYQVA